MSFCESCAYHLASHLIYFNDGGPTFAVCRFCADDARYHGCTVSELDLFVEQEQT